MIRPRYAVAIRRACLLAALIGVPAAVARAAAAPSTATIRTVTAAPVGSVYYEEESRAAFESQLHSHEIREAEFNKVAEHLHLLLRDGHRVYIAYPGHEQPALQRLILASGVPVAIEATARKAAATHHTLRYIVAAVLVIALIVLAALLIARRRGLSADGGPADAGELGAGGASGQAGTSAPDSP